jgi:hypothetical protein
MPVEVRTEDDKIVCKYTGYKYYAVNDRNGNFLFGFHISSDADVNVNVYFCCARVSLSKNDKDRIDVRAGL